MTPTESARSAVLRWTEEVWNRGRLELVPTLVHDPYIRHEPDGSTHRFSMEQSAARVVGGREQFPDLLIDLQHIVAEGDFVTTHWVFRATGPAGEKLLQTGMELFRVADGKIAEVWTTLPFDGEWES